jgi:hypothetical protein
MLRIFVMADRWRLPSRLLLLAILIVASPAEATLVTFDTLTDLEAVTTQFPGLTFTHATVLQAGVSLNEFEFPPHSRPNVVFDDGGPLMIAFNDPQASVAGFFTYQTKLTFTAFDAGGAAVGSALSQFGSNLGLSGEPGSVPNELLSVAFPSIRVVTIQGDPAGGSFVLDDLTFTPIAAPVPEPASASLLAIGLAMLLARRSAAERKKASHE